jgi:GT2 family glycosyltransferase
LTSIASIDVTAVAGMSSSNGWTLQEQEFAASARLRVVSVEEALRELSLPARVTHPDPAIKVVLEPTTRFRRGWYKLEIQFPPDGVVDVVGEFICAGGDQFWQRFPVVDRNSFCLTLRIGGILERLILRISGSGHVIRPVKFLLRRRISIGWIADVTRAALRVLKRRRLGILQSGASFVRGLTQPEMIVLRAAGPEKGETRYQTWMRLFDEVPEQHRRRHQERLDSLERMPLISCLAMIGAVNDVAIARLARGLREQIYPRWELLVAVPKGLALLVSESLRAQGLFSFRIVAAENNTSSTCNALLRESRGSYILKIPEGAMLRPNALLEFAMTVALYPTAELVYSDEDQIDEQGRRLNPKFKPAWSPDFFAVYDYIGHLTLLRREAASMIGGWRDFSSVAIDHDLKLRVTEQVESQNIIHIAKILVSCPATPEGQDDTRRLEVERMLCDHIERRHLPAEVVWPEGVCLPRLRYRIPSPAPLASIIIPTRDGADILDKCVHSILARTRYPAFEILIIDNGSVKATTHRLFAELAQQDRIRILPHPGAFNYSALNNFAAGEARGTILALLNNDIEVISDDWLEEMVALAVRPEIGCVGAKLLYPNGRVQHAGVYLGLGALAVHGYRLAARDSPGQLNRMSTVQNVSAVTAACLVIRKNVFDEVGGFDQETLKVTLNDIDLCLKVRAVDGYLNVWTPFAELIHHESVSRGRSIGPVEGRHVWQERNIMRARWGEALLRDPYYSPNLSDDREDFSIRVH